MSRLFYLQKKYRSDKQTDIRFTREFKEGGGAAVLKAVDEITGAEFKQINSHLTGDQLDLCLDAEAAQLFETGDPF